MMATEAKRGCGYRKVGGMYLVGGALAAPCDRLPFALDRCPTCGAGVKFTRGHTWLQPDFFSWHDHCLDDGPCPICANRPDHFGPHCLLWIGRAHYSPASFLDEARTLGISRRIPAIPKGMVLGETWVLLAHLDAVPAKLGADKVPVCGACGVAFSDHTLDPCKGYAAAGPTPGIFSAFVPRAVELLLRESDATPERREKEQKRGVTIVTVPDDDKDHQGSVWDKDDQEELPLAATT